MKTHKPLEIKDFQKEYSTFFDQSNQNQFFGHYNQVQWEKSGDNFEIFSLFQKGYTKLSCETELIDAQLEGSTRRD